MKSIAIWATASMVIALTAAAGNAASHSDTAATTVSESVLWSFGASGGGLFPDGLIADQRGNLYGTTAGGGAPGPGTVFELSPPSRGQTQWSERVLWNFGGNGDGQSPNGLLPDNWGNLYGTTSQGGANSDGTVFELSPPSRGQTQWSERVLWNFGAGDDGKNPVAGLIADKWGNLYGTAQNGGTYGTGDTINNAGTAFELSPPSRGQTQWREQVLWSFGATGDGENPLAALFADKWGNLYGTTLNGGVYGVRGTVFELSPPSRGQAQWSERVLWSFGASGDGSGPVAGLISDTWGNLYGTTEGGGTIEVVGGTVFELSPPLGPQLQWRERVLWNFGANGDGAGPAAALLRDKWGNLYGTTLAGGTPGQGTVFDVSPPSRGQAQWSEQVLWGFGGTDDGISPITGLIADNWGDLYGTTQYGGANNGCTVSHRYPSTPVRCGTVFELNLH